MRWPWALLWSATASVVATLLMFWGRAAFQVRTLPERVMEWLLLFVPLDQFEKGIETFGPHAKVYTLYGGVMVMAGALLLIGAVTLRRWSGPAILGLGLGLYLVAMGGLMPLTGAGFFARALFQNIYLVNGLYLGVALAYATTLLLGRALTQELSPQAARGSGAAGRTSRRALVTALAGTSAAYAVVLRQGLTGRTAVASRLPLAQLPTGLPAQPPAAPTATVHPGLANVPIVVTPDIAAQVTASGGVAPAAPPEPAEPAPEAVTPDVGAPAAATVVAIAPPAPPEPTERAQVAAPPPQPPAPTTPPPVQSPPPTAPLPTVPPDTSPLPTPEPERALTRDNSGALTALARARGELAALVTPNNAHYVVTKNPVADPALDADTWRLIVDGEVNRPVQVDYQTLRQLPVVEVYKTLECISNFTAMCELAFFGCDLMSTAKWKGARLSDVLDLAGGLKPGVVSLQVQGADEFSSSLPAALATDPNALLVYEMNGETLPREHGYPVRMLTPGRYGFKSAKWVVGIRALRTDYVDWYGQRNWSRTGIVKTMSRIDVPGDGQKLAPGRQRIAGVAYAGDRGVGAVQFSADSGRTWNPTVFLEPPLGKDTWVRWTAEFDIAPGQTLSLQCRAIDGNGAVQSGVFYLPQPNGASGWHTIRVMSGE